MEWQHPQWLYLILPLGAAWLMLALYSRRSRRRAAEAFVAQAMWSRILPADSWARFWVKLALRETALVAGLVALAGPRFGTQYENVIPRGSDLYVLIDVSRSMLAEDVPPSRLGRAKADVAALVNRLEGERVGLIAFAGQAVVKCPLTVDYDAFRRSLDELDPRSAPRGGTAIGDAIRKALEVFQARSDRDQAILLITDGDDQQSYPREAAAIAAERHVTIFTVGLGDADHGARIPQGEASKSFVEYKGQQVWSKLDGSLLKDIALKTTGVYVPAGTRAYDLGELYAKYLQGRRTSDEQGQERFRRSEQFQGFLALALVALIVDAFLRPYSAEPKPAEWGAESAAGAGARTSGRVRQPALTVAKAFLFLATLAGVAVADDGAEAIREGLSWYGQGDFAKAQDRFAVAREKFASGDAAKAAIAAFDQACAWHRKGDRALAREWYLKAGLAHDKSLAASAHFNLGTLAAEEAGRLAGEHPETVPPEKRQEILDQLKAAVASFRHCLDLQPEDSRARRDVELVRQWVKYYTDQWQAHDREKRRQETNLVEFLEFLIETQQALRESVKALTATSPADAFAEPKRLQDELQLEIPPLKEKIQSELTRQPASGSAPQASSPELEQGIKLLQGWASAAGEKMASASGHLDTRQAGSAATDQQTAIDQLEKIWDAVIPFQPLLAPDLKDQISIASSLAPAPAGDPKARTEATSGEKEPHREQDSQAQKPASQGGGAILGTESEDLAPLTEMQERTRRRTELLKLKAEAELTRLEKSSANEVKQKRDEPSAGKQAPPKDPTSQATPIDPKLTKEGYQKAVALVPRAVEQMEQVVKALKQKAPQSASAPAEQARKILEEIQMAQPKSDQQDKKQEDQKKQEQNKKNDEQQKQDQKDQQKQDQQKQEQQKQEEQKQEQEKKQQEQPQPKDQQEKQQQAQRDRIEEALRKVRERQQEKRERDRKLKARLFGSVPVEKDW